MKYEAVSPQLKARLTRPRRRGSEVLRLPKGPRRSAGAAVRKVSFSGSEKASTAPRSAFALRCMSLSNVCRLRTYLPLFNQHKCHGNQSLKRVNNIPYRYMSRFGRYELLMRKRS